MNKIQSLLNELIAEYRRSLEEAEERNRKGLVLLCVEVPKETYEVLKWKAKKHYNGDINRLLLTSINKYLDS